MINTSELTAKQLGQMKSELNVIIKQLKNDRARSSNRLENRIERSDSNEEIQEALSIVLVDAQIVLENLMSNPTEPSVVEKQKTAVAKAQGEYDASISGANILILEDERMLQASVNVLDGVIEMRETMLISVESALNMTG